MLKVLHEPNGFTNSEINTLLRERTMLKKWESAVHLGFCKRYSVTGNLTRVKIGQDPFSKYDKIRTLLSDDLKPLIEIRNTLAHGQWATAFNSRLSNINTLKTAQLTTENAQTVKAKKRIIESIANIINDLIVGGAAFDRDFTYHCNTLHMTSNRLNNIDYEN